MNADNREKRWAAIADAAACARYLVSTNLTLAALLALESYALRVVDMPLGSSLLALAVKR